VIRVDPTRHRLGLSLRQVEFQEDLDEDEDAPAAPELPIGADEPEVTAGLPPLGDDDAPLTAREEDRAEVEQADEPVAVAEAEEPTAAPPEEEADDAIGRSQAGVAEA